MNLEKWADTLVDYMSGLSGYAAYGAIIGVLVICGLGVPIPEDITLLAGGLLASSGQITLTGALIAAFVGVLLGDGVLFFMGRRYGKRIFLLPGFRRIFTAERVRRAEAKIKRNGPFICFVARFLPGLRSPTFAAAGAMGVSPVTFFVLDGFAALLSVPIWIVLGYWFGQNWDEAVHYARKAEVYIVAAMGALIIVYLAWRLWRKRREARAHG